MSTTFEESYARYFKEAFDRIFPPNSWDRFMHTRNHPIHEEFNPYRGYWPPPRDRPRRWFGSLLLREEEEEEQDTWAGQLFISKHSKHKCWPGGYKHTRRQRFTFLRDNLHVLFEGPPSKLKLPKRTPKRNLEKVEGYIADKPYKIQRLNY